MLVPVPSKKIRLFVVLSSILKIEVLFFVLLKFTKIVPSVCPIKLLIPLLLIISAFLVTELVVVGIYEVTFEPCSSCAPNQ